MNDFITVLLGMIAMAADLVYEHDDRVSWRDYDMITDEFAFRARCLGWVSR